MTHAGFSLTVNPLDLKILDLDGSPLLEKTDRHQQPFLAVTLENGAFQAQQRAATNTDFGPRLQPYFPGQRPIRANQPSEIFQVADQFLRVGHRQALRNAICGQGLVPPILIAAKEDIAGKEGNL